MPPSPARSSGKSDNLELIASENYASKAVREAMGCVMTNKYAEGYPGKRYYGGCEWVDVAETSRSSALKQIFGAEHANVQPHSRRAGEHGRVHGASCSRAIPCSACRSRTAATSRTERK